MFLYYICFCITAVTLFLSGKIHSEDQMELFTEKLSRQIIPATEELVRHFRWRTIVLVVQNTSKYIFAASSIRKELKQDVSSIVYIVSTPVQYNYPDDYASIVNMVSDATNKSRIIVLLMDMRLSREYLIAGYDLKLFHGEYVFIAFETDILYISSRQRRPFKWIAVDYSTNWKEYVYRSYKLCQMWKVTLILMLKLPTKIIQLINKKSDEFYHRRRNITLKVAITWARFKRIIFANIVGTRMFGKYPIHLFRFGNNEMEKELCTRCILNEFKGNSSCERFPSTHSVGIFGTPQHQRLVSGKERCVLTFNKGEKIQMYWPGNRSIYDIGDDKPMCRYPGEKCTPRQDNVILVEAIAATGIVVLLTIGSVIMYREYILLKQMQPRTHDILVPYEKSTR